MTPTEKDPPRRPLGSTGLHCHPLGFGSYRISEGIPEHEAALRAYLNAGGNLIDTSANYADGGSETLIGRVLRETGDPEVVVVTKGGYIQGRNMALAAERDFPEVVRYAPQVWHSIHPEFLETQVDLSLERLGRDQVQVYLLHNPEYFLEEIAHRRELTPEDHEEFYRRIREAFAYLESQVEAKRIAWYGVSSNNFNMPAFDPDGEITTMTSVARCLEEARAVANPHHFRVVQLPLNLFESGGAQESNNDGRTVLEFCREEGLGVLANRPLNAIVGGRLVRLADRGGRPPGVDEEIQARELRRLLHEAGYPEEERSLSRMALHLLIQLEGLTCTLVGMRKVEYVEDALGAVDLPGLPAEEVLGAVKELAGS